jgi:HAD superfamily hydrolase (TIGR01549 family)
MKKKLISFDLDQTLVKTTKAHVLAFQMAFAAQKINLKTKDIQPYIDGRHSTSVILSICPKLDKKTISEIRKFHHAFLKKTIKYAQPIKNGIKTLKFLKKRFELAIVTNCGKEETNLLLKAGKISHNLFDVIIKADQVKHPKPYPDEIFKAEKLVHVNSDIHVGDSIYDIIAAKKAKAVSISVLTGQTTKKELLKHHPDFIIKDINYLPKLFSKNKKLF